ncbi:MAG TPA: sugar ABC transporter permease, partial [Paracoccus sp. (in: a-proteobacteria)]|nr:sugar ABC transporter permease [Paracoccus sp. (in: a-proteobacteria)]
MATRQTQSLARLMRAPAIILLLVWMLVPLAMTLYYSFLNYNLLSPGQTSWAGWFNYQYFYTDPAFFESIKNTIILVLGV